MATTQADDDSRATCPLCSDYTGPPSSVEAHISRKTDSVHVGEVGRAHRDHLQYQVGEVRRSDPTDAPSEGGDGTDSTDRDGDVEETGEGVDDDQQDDVEEDQGQPDAGELDSPNLPVEVVETSDEVDGDQQDDVDGEGSVSTAEAVGAAGAAGGTMLLSGIAGGGVKTWHVVGVIVVIGVGGYILASSGSSEDTDDQEASGDQEPDGDQGGLLGEEVWE